MSVYYLKSSHVPQGYTLEILIRLSQVNCVPFPFLPFDLLPHVVLSRISYHHLMFLISLCVSSATHHVCHGAAATIHVTCMTEWRCVLTDHVSMAPASPQVTLLWIRVGFSFMGVHGWAGPLVDFSLQLPLAERPPLCKSSLPSHTQLPCVKVKGMWVPSYGEDFCRWSLWWGESGKAWLFQVCLCCILYSEEHFRITVTEIQYTRKICFLKTKVI